MTTKANHTENFELSNEDKEVWSTFVQQSLKSSSRFYIPDKGLDQSLRYKLDLHGCTVQQAFVKTRNFLEEHWAVGSKYAIIITGKSGKIADEFKFWIDNLGFVKSCIPLTDTSGTHGAYKITFYRK
jgi:DNA-nicking Smr family endonuclease